MSRLAEQPISPAINMQFEYQYSAEKLPLSKESLPTHYSLPNPPKESKKQYTIRILFTVLLSILLTCSIGSYFLWTRTSTPALHSQGSVDEYTAKEVPIALADGWVVPPVRGTDADGTSVLTFEVFAQTKDGESVYVGGSLVALGGFEETKAIALTKKERSIWSTTVIVPADTRFEYKYLKRINTTSNWESNPKRKGCSPEKGERATLHSHWR